MEIGNDGGRGGHKSVSRWFTDFSISQVFIANFRKTVIMWKMNTDSWLPLYLESLPISTILSQLYWLLHGKSSRIIHKTGSTLGKHDTMNECNDHDKYIQIAFSLESIRSIRNGSSMFSTNYTRNEYGTRVRRKCDEKKGIFVADDGLS